MRGTALDRSGLGHVQLRRAEIATAAAAADRVGAGLELLAELELERECPVLLLLNDAYTAGTPAKLCFVAPLNAFE